MGRVKDERSLIQVTRTAWETVSASLVNYEIVHIKISDPLDGGVDEVPPAYEQKSGNVQDFLLPGNSNIRPRAHSTSEKGVEAESMHDIRFASQPPSRSPSPHPSFIERTLHAISSRLS